MKQISYDHFFTVLGNPQRVRIIQMLINEGPLCVSDITKMLHGEQTSISHDLHKLLLCHFVEVEQDGKKRQYSVNTKTIKPLFQLIEKHIAQHCVKGCVHWE